MRKLIFNILHAVFDKSRVRGIHNGSVLGLRLLPGPVLMVHSDMHGTVLDCHPRVGAQLAAEPFDVFVDGVKVNFELVGQAECLLTLRTRQLFHSVLLLYVRLQDPEEREARRGYS